MGDFWKKYKIEILIFATALVVRLFFWVLTLLKFGESGFLYYGDSEGYFNIAKNLLERGIFSQETSPPFLPDFFRTPIYPFFIATVYFLFKNLSAVIVVQNIIAATVPLLIYYLGKNIFSKKVGLAAATFFTLEPNISYWSNELLSETLFTFLLVLSLFFVYKSIFTKRLIYFFLTAAVIGLTILTRPIAIAVPVLFLIFFCIILKNKIKFKKILLALSVFVLTGVAAILPWMIRNKLVFDVFSLTNQGAVVTCNVNAEVYLAYKEAMIGKEAAKILRQEITADIKDLPPEEIFIKHQGAFCRRILRILERDPLGYFAVYLRSLPPFFLGDGYLTMLHKFFPESFNVPPTSLWAQVANIGAVSWMDFFKGYRIWEFGIFLLGKVIWFGVCLFAFVAIFFGWRDFSKRNWLLLFYILIFYFATASGFAAYSRFRYPINPFLILIAFYGLFSFVKFLRSKFAKLRAYDSLER